MTTLIEWTDKVWNPTRGCSRVSAGCENCYAERQAHRFSGEGQPYEGLTVSRVDPDGEAYNGHGPRWTGEVRTVPEMLDKPLRWRKPARVFVDSMSDLFHENIPFEFVAAVFGVMAACPQHTFQVLTKRADRMREFFAWCAPMEDGSYPPERGCVLHARARGCDVGWPPVEAGEVRAARWPLPNVWLGVSVEDQATADARIPALLGCPATLRWASYEPALADVDFARWLACLKCGGDGECEWVTRGGEIRFGPCTRCMGDGDWLDWLVIGGESGPGARPFDLDWARDTIVACKAAGVACFVKQLGARPWKWLPPSGEWVDLRSPKGSDPSEWPEDLRVREMPDA